MFQYFHKSNAYSGGDIVSISSVGKNVCVRLIGLMCSVRRSQQQMGSVIPMLCQVFIEIV